MLPALASRIALRRRALASGSPPPVRAATVISLMNLVKSLPRLASVAPFLCLIECHFECPDIETNDPSNRIGFERKIYHRSWRAANHRRFHAVSLFRAVRSCRQECLGSVFQFV